MEQMTLFSFMPMDVDINITPEADVVQMIGCAIGLDFKFKDDLFGWVVETKEVDFNIKYSNYSFGDRSRFIACGYNYHTKGNIGGAHSPRGTVEDAIDFLKRGVDRWYKEKGVKK